MVELLLTEGKANPNWQDIYGRTPLSLAADHGFTAVVERLLKEQDLDVNLKDKYGWTPLAWASRSGNEDIIRLLLEKAGIINETESHSPLVLAAQHEHATIIELFMRSSRVGEDWKKEGLRKVGLSIAETCNDQIHRLSQLMVTYGMDNTDLRDENGLTLHMKHVLNGNESAVRKMMDRPASANPNAKDKHGRTGIS